MPFGHYHLYSSPEVYWCAPWNGDLLEIFGSLARHCSETKAKRRSNSMLQKCQQLVARKYVMLGAGPLERLEKSRKYVRANLYSRDEEMIQSVQRHHSICELIEESLVGSFAMLEEQSQHRDTLQIMEARQYQDRGLIHIEYCAYTFFMVLERGGLCGTHFTLTRHTFCV